MQIEIPNDQYEKLTVVANAAGFSDVAAFVGSLAEIPTTDPRGELSEEELRASAAECDQAIEDFKSGGGQDFREAMLDIGRKRGFSEPQQKPRR